MQIEAQLQSIEWQTKRLDALGRHEGSFRVSVALLTERDLIKSVPRAVHNSNAFLADQAGVLFGHAVFPRWAQDDPRKSLSKPQLFCQTQANEPGSCAALLVAVAKVPQSQPAA